MVNEKTAKGRAIASFLLYEAPPVNRTLAARPPRGLYHRRAVHVRPLARLERFGDGGYLDGIPLWTRIESFPLRRLLSLGLTQF